MTQWTPKWLAEVLGVDESNHVRDVLRQRHPDRVKHTRWKLGREDIVAVCEWNLERSNTTRAKVDLALGEYDVGRDAAAGPAVPAGAAPDYELLPDETAVREVGAQLLRHARDGGSLLTDRDVWTDANVEALIECFVKQPDLSGSSFFTKLDKQLADVGDEARVLFAEIFLLQMLPISQFLKSTKLGHIERVLDGIELHYEVPQSVQDAFDSPVYGGGRAFASRRFQQISVLIEFVRYLRALTAEERDEAYDEPLEWRKVVNDAPGTSEPSLRATLTYLGHPDYFFPIVAQRHKQDIINAFFPRVTGCESSGDDDRDLATLRVWMDPEPGTTPDFYAEPLSGYWQSSGDDEDEEVVDPEYTVDSIVADGAFHSPSDLRAIIQRWGATRNVVLQGAPGTGKTWLARRLAYALIGSKDDAAIRSVQFHPGTSYEDFVRGWRPGGDGRLELVDGPLIQHAERARAHPDIPHVMIVEEFNRGNPAQALGEMLTLLEQSKRNAADALELTYRREDEGAFFLPDNLFVIGTMNTADRSLALVDFALRRRFAFFDLEPQINDAWKGHLHAHFRGESNGRVDEVARRVNSMNARIADDPALGSAFRIGHSYFTPEKEASELESWFRSVIESSVRPQLGEYWHEDPATVEEITAMLLAEL